MSDTFDPSQRDAPEPAQAPVPAGPPRWSAVDLPWVIPDAPYGDGPAAQPPRPPSPTPGAGGRRPLSPVQLGLMAAVLAFLGMLVVGAIQSQRNSSYRGTGSAASPFNTIQPFGGRGSTAPTAGGTGAVASSDAQAIAAKVDQGVVDIDTTLGYQNGRAAGTGVVLTSSGEVLTNNHVVKGSTSIKATVVSTGKTYTATVVGTYPTEDIAIIQLQGASNLKTVSISSATVNVGDPIVAIGNAGGVGGTPSVVTGSVTNLGQSITASDENGGSAQRLTDLIEVDAPIEAGDSGGPLVNSAAEVVGINTAAEVSGGRFQSAANLGYAIPIGKAISLARQIESGRASSTVHIGLPAFMGVQLVPPQTRRGTPTTSATPGAALAGVEPGTPAATAGMVAGDTITSINGQPVDSASSVSTLLEPRHPGDQVTVGWTDAEGTSHTARLTLIPGPAD